MKPANIKGTNKNAKIYVGRSTTAHNLLFCVHSQCMNYVTKPFYWLVPWSEVNNYCDLCTVKAQKKRAKTYNKELSRVSYLFPFGLQEEQNVIKFCLKLMF